MDVQHFFLGAVSSYLFCCIPQGIYGVLVRMIIVCLYNLAVSDNAFRLTGTALLPCTSSGVAFASSCRLFCMLNCGNAYMQSRPIDYVKEFCLGQLGTKEVVSENCLTVLPGLLVYHKNACKHLHPWQLFHQDLNPTGATAT